VAAINGHAYAGGLITALDCDHGIAGDGALQFSLNEVPIGIPMPAVYCEIIKHAVGPRGIRIDSVRSNL
jgi:enoyl-CoA hydratase